jgi:hypothetical protein
MSIIVPVHERTADYAEPSRLTPAIDWPGKGLAYVAIHIWGWVLPTPPWELCP